MNDERLYVDGNLVDISGDTKITLNVKSNLFRDVSQIASNSTYTVKLPKTVRNQTIMKHADLVQAGDNYAYQMHSVQYFRNGVEIIKNGRLTVLQITDNAIEVCIVWGLYPNFSALISAGTLLSDLQSNDRLLFQSTNELTTYDDALNADYFYARYDVWKHENRIDYTWKNGGGMISPIVEQSRYSSMPISGSGRMQGTNVPYLHPVVKASYILALIRRQTGIDFSFSGAAKEYIDTLIVPLINKKSNELTFDGKFDAELVPTNTVGPVTLNVVETSNVFDATEGSSVDVLNVKSDANVIVDFSGKWQFDITGARPNGSSSTSYDGNVVRYDDYAFTYLYYVKMTVTNGAEVNEYIIGSNRRYNIVKVPSGYQGVCTYQYSGYGKIEVKAGGTIKIEWLSSGTLKDAKFLGGTIKATLSSDENVPSGGYFPISSNLPKIKIIDFVKFLAAITGTFPLQVSIDNTVSFVPLATVWENREDATDWTRRVIAQNSDNKAKAIEFKLNDYAQRNYYKWKEDDTVIGNYDGVLTIDNDTLDVERTIFEFPFAATDGNNVPMYTAPDTSSDSSGHFGNRDDTTTVTSTESNEPSYSACKDRILRLTKGEDGRAQAMFDINMQAIILDKYRHIEDSLRNAKVVTEKIRIRELELLNFDETKPIYLAQYGSYFAVTEIKADGNGLADVTLFKLNI